MAKKMTVQEKRVKLLVGIIRREDEIAFTEACNEACVALHFSALGYGTARSNYLSYLGLPKDNSPWKHFLLSLVFFKMPRLCV